MDAGSPAKVDANRCYEYKLKMFGGWNNIILGRKSLGGEFWVMIWLKAGKIYADDQKKWP